MLLEIFYADKMKAEVKNIL